jgi:hypothetical protein
VLGQDGRGRWAHVFAALTGVTNKTQLTGYTQKGQMSPVIFR